MSSDISATQLFGAPPVSSVFSAGQFGGSTPEQETARTTILAQKREINRIRGYKLQLNPAEKQQLAEIQQKVQAIEKKSSNGTVRGDELDDRLDLLAEADEIIGKPLVDATADDELAKLAGIMEALLNPKLNPVQARRVEMLTRVKDNIEASMLRSPKSATLRNQFRNLTFQLLEANPPRPVSSLSVTERKAYDDLAVLINDRAGAKIQLSAKENIRVAELESSIINLQALSPPDLSQQPTTQQVSRAYTRL